MVIHLCNGKIWTTMDSPPDEHSDLISKCLVHAAYLGSGLFVELVKRDKPLEVIKLDNGVHSYVVGELTIIEQKTFDKTLRTGLGACINNENVPVDLSVPHTNLTENKIAEVTPMDLSITSQHKNKQVEIQSCGLKHDFTHYLELSTSSGIVQESMLTDKITSKKIGESTDDQNTSELATLRCKNRHPYMEILGKMSLKVSVQRYKITNKRQTIHITQNLMNNLPSSKYCKGWDIYIPTDEGSESDTTVIYWPLTDESDSEHGKLDIRIPSTTTHISRQKPTFNVNWHGICREKPRYWFKCKVSTCDSTFSTIRGWNFHHSYVHRSIIFKCEICGQKFTSPSAHRAHTQECTCPSD